MKVGLIGFGGAGTAHLRYFQSVPGCRPQAVYDPKPAGRERAARIAGVRVFDRLEPFWEGLDAVSVCSPDETHADYITEALDRGLHVLCEKPLTDSVAGIQRILAATARSPRTLAVLHQMRFVPLYGKMRDELRAGTLGRLAYLEGYYVHDLTQRAFAYDDWRKSGRATAMIYAGCHFVDLHRWLTGEEPVEVIAAANHIAFPEYPESDLTIAVFKFPSGVLGKVLVSIGTAGPQDHSVRLYGDRASINENVVFGREGRWIKTLHRPSLQAGSTLSSEGSRWRGALARLRWNGSARLIGDLVEALRRWGPPPNHQYGTQRYPLRLYEHQEACLAAVADFAAAVREGRPPACTAPDSARTVLACLAGLEAARENRPVRVARLEDVTG